MHRTWMLALGLAVLSCGGAKAGDGAVPGVTHKTVPVGQSGDAGAGVSEIEDDIDTPISSQLPDASPVAAGPVSPVTFVIKNSADEDLFLNMDKGWGAVIFAYSGVIPNAKSMLMFPKHCTASCDSDPADVCPYCPELSRVKDIKAAENHESVAPGATREVPWDGLARGYERIRGPRNGKRVRCECFRTAEPEPESYTVKACGLRKTQTAKARSKYQCVETTVTLPLTEPVRIELDFGRE